MKIYKYYFMARDHAGEERKLGEFKVGLDDDLEPFCIIRRVDKP